jgi:hypothetical protein
VHERPLTAVATTESTKEKIGQSLVAFGFWLSDLIKLVYSLSSKYWQTIYKHY